MRRLLLALLLLAGCRSCDGREGAPAAAPFHCGRETCQGDQYCSIVSPQVPSNMIPVSKTACVKLPDACAHDASCDCLARAGVQGTCRNVEGGLRVALRRPGPMP